MKPLAPSHSGPGEADASVAAPAGAVAPPGSDPLNVVKPKYGDPCNHYGLCCLTETCKLGRLVFDIPKEKHCPALLWTKEGSRCGLMTEPQEFAPTHARMQGTSKMREAAKFLYAAGKGCTRRDHAGQELPPSLARARWRGATKSEIRKAVGAFGLTAQQWREED